MWQYLPWEDFTIWEDQWKENLETMWWLIPSSDREDLIISLQDELQQDWQEIDPKYKETIIIQGSMMKTDLSSLI